MPGSEPSHWLHRLTAAEWLAAAETELGHCHDTLARRALRPGVTHARRAAGMALNALLVDAPNAAYGRSYMDHVVALSGDQTADPSLRAAAQHLRDTGPAAPALITISKIDLGPWDNARVIVEDARRRVAAAANAFNVTS